jgi:hypothetical protein
VAAAGGARSQDFRVRLDDMANLHDAANHYGRSLAFVRIYVPEP